MVLAKYYLYKQSSGLKQDFQKQYKAYALLSIVNTKHRMPPFHVHRYALQLFFPLLIPPKDTSCRDDTLYQSVWPEICNIFETESKKILTSNGFFQDILMISALLK